MEKILTTNEIITVEINRRPRQHDFEDIIDAARVEADNYGDMPWENCCGYEHTTQDIRSCHEGLRGSAGFVSGEGLVIELSQIDYDEYPGASKQVKAELLAQCKRQILEQLVDWYSNGWQYWGVVIEYAGFYAACWGIDSDEMIEYYKVELAGEIVHEMEAEGYQITGQRHNEAPARRVTRNYVVEGR